MEEENSLGDRSRYHWNFYISIKDILVIVIMILGILPAWINLHSRVSILEKGETDLINSVNRIEASLKEVKNDIKDLIKATHK